MVRLRGRFVLECGPRNIRPASAINGVDPPEWHRSKSRNRRPRRAPRQDRIKKVECLAYGDLGMEASWRIEIEGFPGFIVIEDKGNDYFQDLKLGQNGARPNLVGVPRGRPRRGRSSKKHLRSKLTLT
jgi:hypothetical protein